MLGTVFFRGRLGRYDLQRKKSSGTTTETTPRHVTRARAYLTLFM